MWADGPAQPASRPRGKRQNATPSPPVAQVYSSMFTEEYSTQARADLRPGVVCCCDQLFNDEQRTGAPGQRREEERREETKKKWRVFSRNLCLVPPPSLFFLLLLLRLVLRRPRGGSLSESVRNSSEKRALWTGHGNIGCDKTASLVLASFASEKGRGDLGALGREGEHVRITPVPTPPVGSLAMRPNERFFFTHTHSLMCTMTLHT